MKFVVIFLLALGPLAVQAQKSAVFVTDSVAVRGYDVVAYFTDSSAVKGTAQYKHWWMESWWYFASQEHLTSFKTNPEKYAPQYGGYCAYGTADGHKAPTQPDAWTITDGKLYLNYNKKVMELWRKDQPGFIEKADKNWPLLKHN
ncbi:MAG: YHS domain-containing (seleno)protein [Spirosomataceae bacterium]